MSRALARHATLDPFPCLSRIVTSCARLQCKPCAGPDVEPAGTGMACWSRPSANGGPAQGSWFAGARASV